MVATTLPWPRSLLPLRGAAAAAAVAARGYHRSIESRTFAVAASSSMASSGGEDDAIELARKIRARAPSACWSSDETPAVLAPPPPPANSSSSSSSLPLSGLTFASKEMYDVAGQEPAFGSPAYRRWRQKKASSTSCSTSSYTSTTTAPAVAALVAAGATLVGRTTMSEIAYALTGDHTFYPVPPNPAFEVDDPSSPPRLCGGSSSGSACAVASKSVDFALGSDTGGSVRVPASYCGIFGFRPTHGKVSLEGAQALAPSFDTAGWFAKDAETLRDVGKVLLGGEGEKGEEEKGEKKKSSFDLKRWLVAADAFDKARPEVSKAIFEAVARSKGEIELLLSPPTEVQLWDPEANGSEGAKDAFRFAQAAEVLRPEVLGEFLRSNPELGPVAKERIEWARTVTEEQEAEALKARAALRARLDSILDHDGVIAFPAAPDTAPLAGSGADVAPSRGVLLELTAAAGLGGYPQIVLPVAVVAPGTVTGGGGPVGLSFLGPRGSDSELLELGVTVSRAMKL